MTQSIVGPVSLAKHKERHAELAALLEPVLTHHQWRPQLRDPADEMALETAANARVGALVTYNLRDFIPAKRFGIQVLTPEQAFKYFNFCNSEYMTP